MCKYCCDVGEKKVRPHEISFYAGDPPPCKNKRVFRCARENFGSHAKKIYIVRQKKITLQTPPVPKYPCRLMLLNIKLSS